MAKHTSGPWVGFSDQGKCVAIMPAGRDGDICTFNQPPTEADAALMILAPTMLKTLDEALITLRHAQVFITSRERMHIDGVALYDDLIEDIRAILDRVGSSREGS